MPEYILYPRTGISLKNASITSKNNMIKNAHQPVIMAASSTSHVPNVFLANASRAVVASQKPCGGACHEFMSEACTRGGKCKYCHTDADVSAEVANMKKIVSEKCPAISYSDIDATPTAMLVAMFKIMKNSKN
jgi:hypothetical protein